MAGGKRKIRGRRRKLRTVTSVRRKHGGGMLPAGEAGGGGAGPQPGDVRFLKEGAGWYLRVFIDREDGDVSIDDCVALSRRLDTLLDEADPISQSYCLEVSSPGMERELTRPEHFALCEGWPVVVRLIRPLEDGSRRPQAS